MKASEAIGISSNPYMDGIFHEIKKAAYAGNTSAQLPYGTSEAQINKLKELGYTVTLYYSDDYSGCYMAYWGDIPSFRKPTKLNKFLDAILGREVERIV